jgi:hypothetical protein
MDELFSRVKEKIEKGVNLVPLILPEELSRVRLPLGLMDMNCYNFKGEKVRKLYFMRFKAIPSLDVFGVAIYPEPVYDLPIFVCDLSCTKKKVFTYVNFVVLLNEPSYLKKYIEPMKPLFEKYSQFPPHKARDWMKAYLSPYAIYSLPEKTRLSELRNCALDYLTLYLNFLSQAEKIKDSSYLDSIEKAQKKYIHDLTTYDGSRKMLGRIIGMERSNRIFHEVVS